MALLKNLILPFSHTGQYYPLSRGHSGKPVRLCLQVPVLVYEQPVAGLYIMVYRGEAYIERNTDSEGSGGAFLL